MLLTAATARADEPNCFSKYTKTNVCEAATKMQAVLAPMLPMKLSSDLTLTTVMAIGPKVIVTGMINKTKSEAEAFAESGNTSMQKWRFLVEEGSRHQICSAEPTAAFIRLGGIIEYNYNSLDGFRMFSPEVYYCP